MSHIMNIKMLLCAALLFSSTAALANQQPNLAQEKQKFAQQSHRVTASINQSIAKLNQKQQKLTTSHQKLLKYRSPNNTAQENRCLNAMLQRSNNVQNIVRNMNTRLQQAKQQLPNLTRQAQNAKSLAQLQQSAQQGNRLLKQLKQLDKKSTQQRVNLNKHVDAACAQLK